MAELWGNSAVSGLHISHSSQLPKPSVHHRLQRPTDLGQRVCELRYIVRGWLQRSIQHSMCGFLPTWLFCCVHNAQRIDVPAMQPRLCDVFRSHLRSVHRLYMLGWILPFWNNHVHTVCSGLCRLPRPERLHDLSPWVLDRNKWTLQARGCLCRWRVFGVHGHMPHLYQQLLDVRFDYRLPDLPGQFLFSLVNQHVRACWFLLRQYVCRFNDEPLCFILSSSAAIDQ